MTPLVSTAAPYLTIRQQAVREAMKAQKLDGILLTLPPDLAYLTDFTGDDSVGLITPTDLFLVTDFRYEEQAQQEAPWLKIVLRKGKMGEALTQALGKAKCRRVGFEAAYTTVAQISGLEEALKKKKLHKTVKLVPLKDVLVNIRKTKDTREIDIIRKAAAIAQESFVEIRKMIKPGMTENHLAALLVLEMRKRGASDSSFPPIIGAGPNSSLCHYRPAEVPIQRDQPLLIDWGALYKGYCSDHTRTLMIGKVNPELKKIYSIVLEAQQTAIALVKPGATTKQIDTAARNVIKKAGYEKNFGHGLGHGIGRQIHELPTMGKRAISEPLKPGMIVTVEPGIYLPGIGGVRIEDDVLITETGSEVLSSLDKSWESMQMN
jgi:Xaa-Pro aminopeptidase